MSQFDIIDRTRRNPKKVPHGILLAQKARIPDKKTVSAQK